jgi:endonuclease/exonuclease/phosphatase family metal-dependent hydrolase
MPVSTGSQPWRAAKPARGFSRSVGRSLVAAPCGGGQAMIASLANMLHESRPAMKFHVPLCRIGLAAVVIVLASAGAAYAAPAAKTEPPPSPAFRVMTFNVRNSNAPDGENAWPKRIELLFETVTRFDADLIGFQEVLALQHDEIKKRMPRYAFSGVARDDGKRKGEWSLVGYREDRFTAVTNGDFWLSETPTVVGSKSWDAALTRICSWVRLREKATGRELVFANTHFDHKGVVARQEASRVLSRQLSDVAKGVPAILVGDLNITEDNPAYAVLVKPDTPGAIRWIDAYRSVHPTRVADEASFHAFKGGIAGSRIDFIFHTAHFEATASEIDRSARDGRFPSDHYAVTAVLKLR